MLRSKWIRRSGRLYSPFRTLGDWQYPGAATAANLGFGVSPAAPAWISATTLSKPANRGCGSMLEERSKDATAQ